MRKQIRSITTYFTSIFLISFLLFPIITNAADPLPSLKTVGQGSTDPLPPLPPLENQTTPNYVGGPNLTYTQKTNPVYVDKTPLYDTVPDLTAEEKAALIANDKHQYDYAQALAKSAADPSIPKPPTDTADSLSAAYSSGDAKVSKEYFKSLKSLEEKEASGEPLTAQEQAIKDIRDQEGGATGNDTLGGDLPPLPDLANTDGNKDTSNYPTSPGATGAGGFFNSSPTSNTQTTNTTSATTKVCNNGTCTYTMLAPITGLLGNSKGQYIVTQDSKSLCSLLNEWFRIGIALAGMLAVVMIVLGGFQYATTDSLFDKSEGKEKIQSALWGLLLALTTWLVLNTINPALVKCELTAPVTTLSKTADTSQTSTQTLINDAVMGGLVGGNPLVSTTNTGGATASQNTVEAAYIKVTDQWTNDDQTALDGDDAAAKAAAASKWDGIQSQISDLDTKYAEQLAARNANAGPANQAVLNTIESGYTCKSQKNTNCYEEAVKAGNAAGVNYNTSYQSSDYVVSGHPIGKNIGGDARMPLPGEMVDMYTNAGGVYKDSSLPQVSDPYHSVIVDSIDPTTGQALVWDWGQGLTRSGLRSVTFNITDPNTKEYIGRIYKPTLK